MKTSLKEGVDFYYNEEGYTVLTAKYHLDKGVCCGNACKHCPYQYINVAEPKRTALFQKMHTTFTKKEISFFEQVYQVARKIPRGRVTSYGAIAECLGAKSSARMVGWAMNAAHSVQPKIPAHRVVNRKGLLTGKLHFTPPILMQQLLEQEGVKVEKDAVVDFDTLFWNPSNEL
jgi:methylated-DNA-protein-cysteine methyltransferase related protein